MLLKNLFVGVAAISAGTAAVAQDYLDFGAIPGVPVNPAVQIDLTPMMLGLASATTRAENPAVADLLASIDGVRVRIYKPLDDADDVIEFVQDFSEQLSRDNWEQVVIVQDGDHVRILIQGDDESITGAAAMIVAESEAIFVNVVGSINAQQLADTVAALGAGDLLAALAEIKLAGSVALTTDGLASQSR